MSLSSVHFSSLRWRLRRLWQLWKWSFSQMSPKEGSQDRYDMCIQLMLMSPVPRSGSVSVPDRQPPTWVSVCDFSAYQCAYQLSNNFRTLLLPYIFSLLFLFSMDLWITLFWLCTSCSAAMRFIMRFTGARDWKQLETWKQEPLFVFCLDDGDGSPVCRYCSLLSFKEVS